MAERLTIWLGVVVITGLMAFVPKGIVWLLFGAGVALVLFAAYALLVRCFGRQSQLYLLYWNSPTPWWVEATLGVFGGLVAISAAPGLFFGEPHWAIDHVYRAVSFIIGGHDT
jgi:hypothetical protein